jgi:hypothetical protein
MVFIATVRMTNVSRYETSWMFWLLPLFAGGFHRRRSDAERSLVGRRNEQRITGFLTPEVRAQDDQVSVYIWNPGKNKLRIQALTVRYHARKD